MVEKCLKSSINSKTMLDALSKPDSNGDTVLHLAARSNKYNLVNLILQQSGVCKVSISTKKLE